MGRIILRNLMTYYILTLVKTIGRETDIHINGIEEREQK